MRPPGEIVAVSESSSLTQIELPDHRAGLPLRFFHTLRHSFGTHAALVGVNPGGCKRGWVTCASMRPCAMCMSPKRITESCRSTSPLQLKENPTQTAAS